MKSRRMYEVVLEYNDPPRTNVKNISMVLADDAEDAARLGKRMIRELVGDENAIGMVKSIKFKELAWMQ